MSDQGFSLVETLVALALVAGMTAVLAEVAATSARARGAVRQRQLAAMVARSALDRAAAGEQVESGQQSGLDWHLARAGYGQPDPFDRLPLEQLTVTVRDAAGRQLLSLETLRVRR